MNIKEVRSGLEKKLPQTDKIKISAVYIRDLDGIFKKVPMNLKDLFFSQFLSKDETKDFIKGIVPQKLKVIFDLVSKTSWIELHIQKNFLSLSIFGKPKYPVKSTFLDEELGRNILFVFLTIDEAKVVLIDRKTAFGDLEILDFFV
ncbi:MAG: hypothetical protein N2254_06495 [bacterium]|nr:hypothetical protein [bacterium]